MASTSTSGTVRSASTDRKDWDSLVEELFASVIAGAPFAIGIATKQKGFLGVSMKMRLNQRFPSPAITQYIRKRLQVAKLDQIFTSGDGLTADAAGLYKVVGDDVGLPKNCLLMPFENPADANLRGVLLFGGERLEGQLERRLAAVSGILGGAGRSSARGGVVLDSAEKLEEALSKLNVKRLFEVDLDLLARIVNGLEDHKDDLPKNLKPVFKSASDYILKRRLKRH